MTTRTTLAATLAGLAATGVVALAGGDATARDGRTLRLLELEQGAKFTHIRNTKGPERGIAQGDVLAFTIRLGWEQRDGTLSVGCINTTAAKDFRKSTNTCDAIIELPDGSLSAQVSVTPGRRVTRGMITGGTGAYANATGTFTGRRTRDGVVDVIELAG